MTNTNTTATTPAPLNPQNVKPNTFHTEEARVKAFAGADVQRYPDGRPVLFLNNVTPLTFDQYKRYCRDQRRMDSLSRTHLMQWPKTNKKAQRFLMGKGGDGA